MIFADEFPTVRPLGECRFYTVGYRRRSLTLVSFVENCQSIWALVGVGRLLPDGEFGIEANTRLLLVVTNTETIAL